MPCRAQVAFAGLCTLVYFCVAAPPPRDDREAFKVSRAVPLAHGQRASILVSCPVHCGMQPTGRAHAGGSRQQAGRERRL